MEQSGKCSPQSEFWNIREKGRKGGKKVVTHSRRLGWRKWRETDI